MSNSHSVLITGANGFIGSYLMPLLQADASLTLYPLAGRQTIDLRSQDCLEQLSPADAIVHLAGVVGVDVFEQNPFQHWQDQFLIMLHLLEHAKRSHCKRLVLASSYLYGQPQYLPIDEQHPLLPHHAYQRSKYLCEQLAEQYALDAGFELIILRIFNIYGPGQKPPLLIPTILEQLQQADMHLRDPHPKRDYVHVQDVARAFVAALNCQMHQTIQIYNIGFGSSYSVAELVDMMLKHVAHQPRLHWQHEVRKAEVNDVVADIRKAKSELGWQPHISLHEGLKQLICGS